MGRPDSRIPSLNDSGNLIYLAREGRRIQGLDWLFNFDADSNADRSYKVSQAVQIALIKGMLLHSSVVTVDQLVRDVALVEEGGDVDDTTVLSQLPPDYRDFYDAHFVRRFLAAMIDVVSMLMTGWHLLATTAHELAFGLLLVGVDFAWELFEIPLEPYWYEVLLELQANSSCESLYMVDPPIGTTSIEQWFTPLISELTDSEIRDSTGNPGMHYPAINDAKA